MYSKIFFISLTLTLSILKLDQIIINAVNMQLWTCQTKRIKIVFDAKNECA